MENVEGKSVIVTGSNSGIGRATAIEFAKFKARVLLTGRNEEALLEAVAECEKISGNKDNVCYVIGDLCKEETRRSIITTAVNKFGGIDILVNNAGLNIKCSVETTTMDSFDKLFDINVKAVFRITQLAIPYLKQSKGNIVNVSSVFATTCNYEYSPYCMTKAALNMFTDALALELSPHGVRANAVSPGLVKTGMQARIGVNPDELQQHLNEFGSLHPIGRYAQPTEIAHVIVFLASDKASFMTGSKVPVDGGLANTASWFQPSEAQKPGK